MTAPCQLSLYLPPHLRRDHEAGAVNILSRILEALPGWRISDFPEAEGADPPPRPGFGLTHMQEPLTSQTLCLRRAYWYPFWQIERTNQRWNFAAAHKTPDFSAVPRRARAFHERLRRRVLGPRAATREGFIYMPLQGRLLSQRSFQARSPVEMIRDTLALSSLPLRATLHPRESYFSEEITALRQIEQSNPRFQLVSAQSADLIAACDYVVCQNSSVALQAMVAGKGAVLFAGIDFHHQAGSVPRDGLETAFAMGSAPPARMTEYLWWFFRIEAIDAQAPDAGQKIASVMQSAGWPVGNACPT